MRRQAGLITPPGDSHLTRVCDEITWEQSWLRLLCWKASGRGTGGRRPLLPAQQRQPGDGQKMEELSFLILISPDEVRKIAVNCRCGTRTVFEVPSAFTTRKLEVKMVLILSCPKCKQKYGLYKRVIHALDENMVPMGRMAEAQKPTTDDELEMFDGKPIIPGNKEIN
jgi:hypothetical protein